MKIFDVAFFGHRYINNSIQVGNALEKHIRRLIDEKEYVNFRVGRNGDFDLLVSSILRGVKKNYRDNNCDHTLVLPYFTAEYNQNEEAYEKYYDYIEVSIMGTKVHPKAAIQIRNREMVDKSDLIICYFEQKKGGAYQTVRYAEKMGKPIINLFNEIE